MVERNTIIQAMMLTDLKKYSQEPNLAYRYPMTNISRNPNVMSLIVQLIFLFDVAKVLAFPDTAK